MGRSDHGSRAELSVTQALLRGAGLDIAVFTIRPAKGQPGDRQGTCPPSHSKEVLATFFHS